MALRKAVVTPQGLATYHTIGVWEARPPRTRVELMGYPDEASRRLCGEPCSVAVFEFTGLLTLPEIYEKIKQDPAWSDAEDI